jgi:hypothetical protein
MTSPHRCSGYEPAAPMDRRDFLARSATGLAGIALVNLLGRDGFLHADVMPGEADDPPPHFAPRARRIIHIFACGGLSHVDSFDYKPELIEHHGKELGGEERPDVFFGQVGLLHRPFWDFKQRGQSGLWISGLFPNLAAVADELTVIRSMFAETSNHTPATFQANSGFRLNGFPVLGSWLSYGLGAETDDLPTYVVLPDSRGVPAGGSINWTAGFLPGRHQGVMLRSKGPAIADLFPAKEIPESTEAASRNLLAEINRRHLEQRGQSDLLAARIYSYELAAKMQQAVPEVTNLQRESKETHALYGLDRPETTDVGRNGLLARRLVERGVRFVQIFAGGAFGQPRINWDGHENVPKNHGREAGRIDLPLAGLIRDLRRRGMLDDTLVMLTTEFGRTPFTQSADGVLGQGRDHNQYGYSVCLAGGGLKPGLAYGATDPLGLKAVEDPVSIYDFHATVLHLLGIDHERLTYYHNGIRRRLTNVHGRVLDPLLA